MRCPNCGNENPPDYVFCDECGARLQGIAPENSSDAVPAGASGGAGETSDGASAMAGDGGMGMEWQPSGSTVGGAGVSSDTMGSATESPQPDMNLDSLSGMGGSPGYADHLEHAGAGGAGGDSAEASSMGGIYSPLGGLGAGTDTGGGTPSIGDLTSYDQSSGMAGATDDAAGDMAYNIPVSEDTMETGADEDIEDEAAMPDVVPITGQYSDGGAMDAGASSEATGTSAGGDREAATMRFVEEAQRALDNLRQHLQGAAPSQPGDVSASQSGMGVASGATMGSSAVVPSDTGSNFMPDMTYTPEVAGGGISQPDDAAMDNLGGAMSGEFDSTGGSGASSYDMASGGTASQTGSDAGTDIESSLSGMFDSSPVGSTDAGSSLPEMIPPVSVDTDADGQAGTYDSDAGSMGGVATLEPAAEAGTLGGAMPPAPVADEQGTTTPAEGTMARLVLIATGAEMPIPDQEEILVGREDPSSGIYPDVDLTPYGGEDGGVSRRHARLLHIGEDYFVEDLQSTNYTKLDGQRLPAHARERLEDGARLDFGRVATIFRRS